MHMCSFNVVRHGVLPVPVSGERNWMRRDWSLCGGLEGEWGVCAEEVEVDVEGGTADLDLLKKRKRRADGIV